MKTVDNCTKSSKNRSSKSVSTMYPKNLNKIRKKEFVRIKDQVYLDFTGASLYSEQQVKDLSKCLQQKLFGNPHSGNPSSDRMTRIVAEVRNIILKHFNVTEDEYDVIFTSGTTASLKMLAQSFSWICGKSTFAYLEDNHTSVVGIREAATECGAMAVCLKLPRDATGLNELKDYERCVVKKAKSEPDNDKQVFNLFAFPAQSNFSGRKYPLDWINEVQQNGLSSSSNANNENQDDDSKTHRWYVVLDAAAFVPTSPLDLTKHNADFVCMSFYKMFGLPTGTGALLVRKEAANVLNKKHYFGGGTTDMYIASHSFVAMKSNLHERFEEGTIGFLDILALKFGFQTLERITGSMQNISDHVFSLIKRMLGEMQQLSHGNGKKVCEIYSYSNYDNSDEQGAVIPFNILKDDGSYVGFISVLATAAFEGIHLRGGCFCNYGSCNRMLKMGEDKMIEMYRLGYKCGEVDLVSGVPVGALRISLGYMSTRGDVKAFVRFLRKKFVSP